MVVSVLFLLLYVVYQKTSSLEKGKRNEKQSNEHIEIFCCFCIIFFFFEGLSIRKCICFRILVSF